eukprot:scaffold419_cov185-Chaetoceros_neogracile.AAC.1
MISRWRKKRQNGKSKSILPTLQHSFDNNSNSNSNGMDNIMNRNATNASPSHKTKVFRSPKPGSINCIPRQNGMSINPNNVGCHTFLMGGQYYPGKDKSRVHLRRKTLWYRIFLSSPFRRGISTLVMLYLSAVYILNPGFNLLLHYGKILSHRQGGAAADPSSYSVDINVIHNNNDGEKGSTLKHLKPLKVAREDATKIMQRLKEIKNEKMSVQKRKELIRKVIPDWFRHGGMDAMEHSDIGGGAGSEIDGAGIMVEEHVEESAKDGKQKTDDGQVEAQSNSNSNINAEEDVVPDAPAHTDHGEESVKNGKQKVDDGQVEAQSNSNSNSNAEEDVVPDAPAHTYHGGESVKNGKQKIDDGQVEAQSNSDSNAEEDVVPDAPAHTYHEGESVNEKQKIDDGQMEAQSNSNSNSNAEEDVVPDAPAHTDLDPDAVPHADLDAVQEEQSAIDPTIPDEEQQDTQTSDIIRTLRNK